MSSFLAKIQVHPDKEAEFESVMEYMYRETHSTEQAVLRYEYWRGHKPGFYYCLLSFASPTDFWQHQASNHHEGQMQRFIACIAELDLETIDPVQNASPLPATEEGVLEADAPQPVCEQAELFPVTLAQWWLAHRDQASISLRP